MEDIIDIIVTETTNTIEITAQPNDEIIDVNIIDNREDVTLNVTPTVVEININSLTGNFGVEWGDITGTLADQEDLQDALDLKADLVDGKVPSSQLPSYVDDIVEVANYAALPATGEIGKIYVVLDTNKIYRWSGSAYIEIADSTAVWGAITGTLSSQTDLQSALDAKLSTTTAASTYVPYTGATSSVNLGTNDLTSRYLVAAGASALGGVISMRQDATYLAKGNGYSSIASSSVMFDFFGYTGASTYKNFSLRFDGLTDNTLRTYTLPDASGTLALTSNLTAYVPYTGATANVDLGTHTLLAAKGTFSSSGSSDTVGITHSSGSGIALNISKAGNGEGIYVNKSSGSGNAVTIVGTLNATTLVKNGGTSSQFLKADGSVDSTAYLPLGGGTLTGNLNAQTIDLNNSTASNALRITHTNGSYHAVSIIATGNSALYASGSVTVIGTIQATSTIIAQAGLSNGAGQSFALPSSTGTLALTSQLSSYLPLAGGTLTGALSGTSATFSSFVDGLGLRANGSSGFGSSGVGVEVGWSGTLGYVQAYNRSTSAYQPIKVDGSTVSLQVSGTERLGIASSGAANFSSSVTATSLFVNAGTGSNLRVISGGTNILNVSNYSVADGFREFLLGGSELSFYSGTAGGGSLSERMRITSAGNVGIGTTAPSDRLNVVVGSNGNVARFDGPTSGLIFQTNATTTDIISYGGSTPAYRALNFSASASTNMTITTAGNVGIGTTSPAHNLSVVSGTNSVIYARGGSTSHRTEMQVEAFGQFTGSFVAIPSSASTYGGVPASAVGITTSSTDLVFATNNTQRLRLTTGGVLDFNGDSTETSVNDKFAISFSNGNYAWLQSFGGKPIYLNRVGNAVYAGTQRIDNNSDARIKSNIQNIENALETVLSLSGKKFNMLDENNVLRYGFIAQEVQPHLNDFVTQSDRKFEKGDVKIENLLTLESSGSAWGALLVEAIKELKAELDTLKNK